MRGSALAGCWLKRLTVSRRRTRAFLQKIVAKMMNHSRLNDVLLTIVDDESGKVAATETRVDIDYRYVGRARVEHGKQG